MSQELERAEALKDKLAYLRARYPRSESETDRQFLRDKMREYTQELRALGVPWDELAPQAGGAQ